MSSPTIDKTGEAVQFHWDEYQLTIVLDRFRDSHGRGLEAELLATTTAPGYHPILTQARLTLTSLRTRAEFAKRLTQLYPEANWDEVIEQVCVLGLRAFRQGEPVLRITDQAQADPPPYCLDPLVYEGLPSVLFGPGGIGKSYLALFLAMLVQQGGRLVGFSGAQGSVLYLDYETDYGDLVHRARFLRRGHPELNPAQPFYRRSSLPIADDLPALHRIVAESQIKLLVIDSLAAACGADLLSPETAIRFFAALRSLRVASLTLAHVAKHAEEKSIYGSVFFSNFARSVWEMKKVQEAGESVTRIGLYHRKANLGPIQRPIGLKLQFGDAVQFEPLELEDEPELAQALPLKTRIEHALASGAKTAKDISAELDAPLTQIRNRLSEGRDQWATPVGKVDGEIRWGLLSRRESSL